MECTFFVLFGFCFGVLFLMPYAFDIFYKRKPLREHLVFGLLGILLSLAGLVLVGIPIWQLTVRGQNWHQTRENLQKMGDAMAKYEETHGHLPSYAIFDKHSAKPLLSWRVTILPHLGEDELFSQFHLNEPWDSQHNKQLIMKMPVCYQSPWSSNAAKSEGLCHYQVFVGNEKDSFHPIFLDDPKHLPRTSEIPDGSANTILLAEALEPVPWTKPADLFFDSTKPVPKIYFESLKETAVLWMANGNAMPIYPQHDKRMSLRQMITANGGEVVNFP